MNKKLIAKPVAATSTGGKDDSSEVVLSAMGVTPTLGLSCGGDEKWLKDLLSAIEDDRFLEDGVPAPKTKGKRELKNLECSINFGGGKGRQL
jgi:hypothetical protein